MEPTVAAEALRLFTERTGFPPSTVHLLGYVGSIAHGTHTPSNDPNSIDDVDIMGIVIPPPERVIGGAAEWEHVVIKEGVIDAVFYSLRKAAGLLVKANPNIVGLLWLKPEHYLIKTGIGIQLVNERHLFATTACYHSFLGYSYGQLHRMEAFDTSRMDEYEWLTSQLLDRWNPREVLEADSMKLAHIIKTLDGVLNADQVHRFRSLHKQYFLGYMGEKRKKIVREKGYDTKNAAHLIRLMRMCCEFLTTGAMQVDRTGIDAEELKAIKVGDWTVDQVKAEAESLFARAKALRDTCALPTTIDLDAVARLTSALHLSAWQLAAL